MTVEMLLYLIGSLAVPVAGGAIYVLTVLRRLDALLSDPSSSPYSSHRTDELIEHNTAAINNLTHYIKWLAEQTSVDHRPPPPPLR